MWCAVLILWAPRAGARRPGVGQEEDVFPFSRVLGAAGRVRSKCLDPHGAVGTWRMLGREWVSPRWWVEVQFAGVWGPEVMGMGMGNPSADYKAEGGGRSGMVKVRLADGRNVSVSAVDGEFAFGGVGGCGGPLELRNGTARMIG